MKKRTKNCHYVQQAYLKNFACNQKKSRVFVYDKLLNKILEKTKKIKNIANKDYFYPQWLEDWLNQHIELYGIDVIRKLSYRKNLNILSDVEKSSLLNWINVQFIRTLEFQYLIFSALNKFFELTEGMNVPAIPSKFIEDFKEHERNIQKLPKYESVIKKLLHNFIKNNIDFNKELSTTHQWVLIENQTPFEYYTSDNPVIIGGEKSIFVPFEIKLEWIGNQNFLKPKTISVSIDPSINFFLPLTPRLLLLIWNKNITLPSFSIQNDINHINKFNTLIVTQCTRYVFSQTKNFDIAINARKQFPESILKDKNRIRSRTLNIKLEKILKN